MRGFCYGMLAGLGIVVMLVGGMVASDGSPMSGLLIAFLGALTFWRSLGRFVEAGR